MNGSEKRRLSVGFGAGAVPGVFEESIGNFMRRVLDVKNMRKILFVTVLTMTAAYLSLVPRSAGASEAEKPVFTHSYTVMGKDIHYTLIHQCGKSNKRF